MSGSALKVLFANNWLQNLNRRAPASVVYTQLRFVRSQQKWRMWRVAKMMKPIHLPDYDKSRRAAAETADERRAEQQRKPVEGRVTSPITQAITLSCTNDIKNAYVPPEGDGKASYLSTQKMQQTKVNVKEGVTTQRMIRKIKQYDKDFKRSTFPQIAQEIYVEAHKLLENVEKNEDRLHELVTEHAYPQMVWKLEKKTLRWQFIESIEPPRVVHVEVFDQLMQDNAFSQITVRFHTKQTLAVYDRFGRLMFGSEHMIKDCLEYVVFEKHLADEYGAWRLHAKVIPKWLPPSHVVYKTHRRPKLDPEDLREQEEEDRKAKEEEEKEEKKKKKKDKQDEKQEQSTA